MKKVFVNDPFARVYQVFKELYPDKDCYCFWKENLEGGYGVTAFPDNPRLKPEVFISADLPVKHAVEILAHELAHVAVGSWAEHGEAWEEAFDAIHRAYCGQSCGEENEK